MLESRTGRPVSEQPACLFTQLTDRFVIDDDDMDSNTAAKSGMPLKSRSFLHRVYDRVRKILDQSSKDAMQDNDKQSLIWGMFMSSTLEASVFRCNNYSENLHSIKNTGNNITLKQMFDISEKLIVGQSDEIYGVTPTGKILVISLSHAKVDVFSNSVLCLGRKNENPLSKIVWEDVHQNTELWTHLMVSQRNSSGMYSQDSPHCSSATKSMSSCLKWAIHQNLLDESSSCRCSITSHGDLKAKNGNAMLTLTMSIFAKKDSQQDVGHSSDLDQKSSGILLVLTDHKENGTESLTRL